MDRLVDVMNGISFSEGKDRDVELVNTPRHRHIFELFGILRLFEEWKNECGGFTKKFITIYTYEDFVWWVFGVAAAASLYQKDDGSRTMHQGCSGSDVCEHFLSQIRYINSNPTMQQACEGASSLSGGLGMDGKTFQCEDRRANSGQAPKATAADLVAPIARPHNK